MRIVATLSGRQHLRSFERLAGKLAEGRWKRDAHRGVVDAGRKTKTQVQRAVHRQMGTRFYQADVVAGTRQRNDAATLSATIFAVPGGQRLQRYKGLRVLKKPKGGEDGGAVRSGVWIAPRVFKRSFGTEGGTFATLPGGVSTTAPRALWTFGAKKGQPRGDGGRFASSGIKYGKIRRLYGPALRDEIGEGQALATFQKVAPVELETKVMKRVARLIRL